MSGQSPANVLYSSDGYELAVQSGSAIPAGTRALLISGQDGSGNAHFVPTTQLGVLGTTEMANSRSIISGTTVTSSGSQLVTTNYFGTQEIALVVNVGTVTGAGSIQFTIQEVDPGDGVTVYGNSANTVSISTGNAPGVFTAVLNISTSSMAKVTWTVTSTFSATIYATVVSKATPATQSINGSITATNPSVSTDGAAASGSDTQVGGIVSLNNPTYTAGNLNALSLTTEGGLRVFTDGYATTAAPSYTNNTSNPLSLTTAGALRVDGSAVTQPVSGTVTANQGGSWTVTANQGTSPWVTSVSGTVAVTQSTSPWIVAGGGTAGTPASGVVTIQGIAGMTHLSDDGYAFATTAAPSYTNSTWNPLSVDLAGNLRTVATQGTTPWVVVTNKAATSSVTSVAQAVTNTVLLAANATRQFASIYNFSGQKMFIKLGTTASTSSYSIKLMPNSYWEVPVDYTGEIDAVWSGAGGNGALVTELTP